MSKPLVPPQEYYTVLAQIKELKRDIELAYNFGNKKVIEKMNNELYELQEKADKLYPF